MALAIAWPNARAEAGADRARFDAARLEIAAQPLPQAIAQLAREANVSIGAGEPLPPLRSRAVHGGASIDAVLAEMLAGTGYGARRVGPTAWRIERAAPPPIRRVPVLPTFTATDPIIVTAGKRAMPLAGMARAIAVVRLEGLRQLEPGMATADIAASSEGLSTTALGPGQNRMFLRGIADSPFNGSSPSTVAVLLGDSRMTYSAPDPDLRLVDVERVELLKGPQGSLYGTGALGGIYRIVPNSAKLDRAEAAVQAGVTMLADGGAGISASAVANLPVVRDRLGLRMAGYVLDQPGWIDTGARNDSNRERTYGARGTLAVDAGGGWRMELGGIVQFIETRDTQYVYAPGSRERPAQLPEPHDNDFRGLTARAAGPLGNVHVVLLGSLTWHEVDDTLDATRGGGSFGLSDPALFEDRRAFQVWESEARFSGNWGGSAWVAGFSHVESRESEARELTGVTSPTVLIDRSNTRIRDTGLFADLETPVGRRWSVDLGGRLQNGKLSASRESAAGTSLQSQSRWTFLPSAALAWRPAGSDVVFLRYGSASRQGGGSFNASGRVENFAGDTVRTLEAGWRHQLPRGGQIELGANTSWWDHVQSDTLLPNGLIQTRDAGNARIFGGEATLDWPLAPNWRVLAGASVTHARLVSNRLGIALDDRRLPVVPDWTARSGLVHDFRLGAVHAEMQVAVRYIGPARLSFDRALDRPMGRLWESSLELALAWRQNAARLRVNNLPNAAADAFAYGNPFRIGTPQYAPQRPLSVSLSLARQF
ncbi:MAG: TonB-dependent receptor [Sphingomonadales bacterium]|nr:TonB-dependent receptor [Sphingomonadales bacterium]